MTSKETMFYSDPEAHGLAKEMLDEEIRKSVLLALGFSAEDSPRYFETKYKKTLYFMNGAKEEKISLRISRYGAECMFGIDSVTELCDMESHNCLNYKAAYEYGKSVCEVLNYKTPERIGKND